MDLSPNAVNTRLAACRIPALTALLGLLNASPHSGAIQFYSSPRPDAGATPAGTLVVAIPLPATAGSVNSGLYQIQLTVPIEAQITGADSGTGTTVTWARVLDGAGAWFADVSVSDEAGSGEIKLQTTLLYNGAYCRLTSAVFQG